MPTMRNQLLASAFGAMLTLAAATPVFAQEAKVGDITVKDAWVRGTVGGQRVTGLFMRMNSPTGATLIGVDAPVSIAGAAEIHESRVENDIARMHQVPRVELPAGKPIELKPGGSHVMLFDVKRPLRDGDTVPLKLRFEQAGKIQAVEVRAQVRRLDHAAARGDLD